ncbi:unnamed protein product [Moneuplotes crassus]|uniref:Uncharacterized protein n=1 Tax=Euplotes crassus TaxID=5936 RepID=A0AAD1XGL5_EUPCR|nr:unnamed protein product [Moneuplotes crassus]
MRLNYREKAPIFPIARRSKALLHNRRSLNHLTNSQDNIPELRNSGESSTIFGKQLKPNNNSSKRIFRIPKKANIQLKNSNSIPSNPKLGLSNTFTQNQWKVLRVPSHLKEAQSKNRKTLANKVFFNRRSVPSHRSVASENLSLLSGYYSLHKFKNSTEIDAKSVSKSHLSATRRKRGRTEEHSVAGSKARSNRFSNLYKFLKKKRSEISNASLPPDYLEYESQAKSIKENASYKSKLTQSNLNLFNNMANGVKKVKFREKSLIQSIHSSNFKPNKPCKVLDLEKDLDKNTEYTQEDGPADPKDVELMEYLEKAVEEEVKFRRNLEKELEELRVIIDFLKQK